jgi:hypothetical protein
MPNRHHPLKGFDDLVRRVRFPSSSQVGPWCIRIKGGQGRGQGFPGFEDEVEGSCDEVDEEGEKGNDEKVGQPIGSSPEDREPAKKKAKSIDQQAGRQDGTNLLSVLTSRD